MKQYLDEDFINELRSSRRLDLILNHKDSVNYILNTGEDFQMEITKGEVYFVCATTHNGKSSKDLYATFTYDGDVYTTNKSEINDKIAKFYYSFDDISINESSTITVTYK